MDRIQSRVEINRERVIVFLIVVVLIITGSFVYYKNQKAKSQSSQVLSLTEQREQENRKLIEKVGKLILLPTNEQPTIATITDKS